jgi:hypothetical protein
MTKPLFLLLSSALLLCLLSIPSLRPIEHIGEIVTQ